MLRYTLRLLAILGDLSTISQSYNTYSIFSLCNLNVHYMAIEKLSYRRNALKIVNALSL